MGANKRVEGRNWLPYEQRTLPDLGLTTRSSIVLCDKKGMSGEDGLDRKGRETMNEGSYSSMGDVGKPTRRDDGVDLIGSAGLGVS